MALKTFIRGLTGTLQSIIRFRDPKSLETAMNLVVEEQISTITNKSLKTLRRAQIGLHSKAHGAILIPSPFFLKLCVFFLIVVPEICSLDLW
jgi:hypothetical protein